MRTKKWILNKKFLGQPTEENLKLTDFGIWKKMVKLDFH